MADRIIKSKIVCQQRPLEGIDSNSLFDDVEDYIKNNTKKYKNSKLKKPSTIGVKG